MPTETDSWYPVESLAPLASVEALMLPTCALCRPRFPVGVSHWWRIGTGRIRQEVFKGPSETASGSSRWTLRSAAHREAVPLKFRPHGRLNVVTMGVLNRAPDCGSSLYFNCTFYAGFCEP